MSYKIKADGTIDWGYGLAQSQVAPTVMPAMAGPTPQAAEYMNNTGINPLGGTASGDTTLGLDSGTWGNIGAGLNIAQGLAGLYLGNKQLGLAEDQFAFNKDMATKEYALAKDAYDRNVKRAEGIGTQMRAGSSSQ